MGFHNRMSRLVGLVDQAAHFQVDLASRFLAEIAMLRDLAAQEDLLLLLAEGERTQAAHAVLANHAPGQISRALNIAARACGHLVEENFLCHASAVSNGQIRFQVFPCVVVAVAGQKDRNAQSHAARNDGDLVDGVGMFAPERYQRVAGLVVRRHSLLFLGQQHRLALGAHQDLVLGYFEVVHGDLLAIDARGVQRCLIDHVGQVGAAEARCPAGQHIQVGIVGDRNLLHVHAEDFLAPAHIRQAHHHAAVKAPRPQQRGIQHVRPVGGRHQDHAVIRFKAVHLHQQLVQRLLALIVSAAQSGAAMTPHRVNFIDEDDAGSILLALLKQVADAACAHAHKHLHKVRARNREERHIGLAGHCTRKQRLARSRRAHQQNSLGNAPAQLLEPLRLAQVFNNLLKFFLGLVHAGHILEGDLLLLHREQARAALAERQRLVAARLHLPHEEEPDGAQQHKRTYIQQQRPQQVGLRLLDGEVHIGGQHRLLQIFVVSPHGGVELVLGRSLQMPSQIGALDRRIQHLPLLNLAV